MTKVLTNEEHNAKINVKINELKDKIADLEKDLKAISPVKQASLAECNAMSKVNLKPQAPQIKIRAPEAASLQPQSLTEGE